MRFRAIACSDLKLREAVNGLWAGQHSSVTDGAGGLMGPHPRKGEKGMEMGLKTKQQH